ncbi:Rad2 nuclease [Entomophthora muscae]|uniref:Rad2 nuclease n=1 Tax=Entomophthora muscae TaxID=34485 RepID=A0ACC2TGU4_9FUNG|nr:Rad2 nuclease [Entomophthora muscae]
MGITGLLPALKSIARPISLEEYRGKTVGVDAYVWLHRAVHGCAYELGLGIPTTRYLSYCTKWLDMFAHYGVTPYLVFDGRRLPSKLSTETERQAKRQSMRKLALSHHLAGEKKQAEEYFQRSIDITPEIAYTLMQVLIERKLPYVVAPYEADAQLAFLSRNGHLAAVVSEDSDLLVFECPRVIYKLDITGAGSEIRHEDIPKVPDMQRLFESNPEKFRHLCILSGCDYLPSVQGIGLKTAAKFIASSSNYLEAIKTISHSPRFKVPSNYAREFVRAEMTFRFQWVYDPTTKEIVHLTSPPDLLAKYDMLFLGEPITDKKKLQGLITGILHPDTLKPISVAKLAVEAGLASPFGREISFVQPKQPTKPNSKVELGKLFTPVRQLNPKVVTSSQSRHFVSPSDSTQIYPCLTPTKSYSTLICHNVGISPLKKLPTPPETPLNSDPQAPSTKRSLSELSRQDEAVQAPEKRMKLDDLNSSDLDFSDEEVSSLLIP